MKIFLLIASFPDSIIKFRGALLDALIASGLDVHVAAPDLLSDSALCQQLAAKGVHPHNLPLNRTGTNPLTDISSLYHMYSFMARLRPDFVLGYTIKPIIYGTLAARLAGVPRRYALITGLGYVFTNKVTGIRRVLQKLVSNLYALSLSNAHMVMFQNPDDLHLFRSQGILPAYVPACLVNGSGVNLTEYTVAPLPIVPRFLLIARLLGDKGIREYVAAAKQIRDLYPDTVFELAGWVDDNPDAISQRELDEWINTGTIHYLGRLADVRPAIANCSVYVLPSYREGTPRTVLEAMAMGRAIITTDAPGCRETVTNSDNGFLVAPQSVDELVAAMQHFIDNPQLLETMGKRSRHIAEIKYDVHKVNAVMLKEMGIT